MPDEVVNECARQTAVIVAALRPALAVGKALAGRRLDPDAVIGALTALLIDAHADRGSTLVLACGDFALSLAERQAAHAGVHVDSTPGIASLLLEVTTRLMNDRMAQCGPNAEHAAGADSSAPSASSSNSTDQQSS
jgi:hypothetical protein